MKNCPNCNSKLPFFKIGFLSKRKNTIECPDCSSYLIGNKKYLSSNGSISGASAGLLMFITVNSVMDGSETWKVTLPLSIIVIFFFAVIQAKNVPLEIGEKPKKQTKPEYIKPPSKDDRMKYLKFKFRNKSSEELNEILSSNGYTKEAKSAADELIKNL